MNEYLVKPLMLLTGVAPAIENNPYIQYSALGVLFVILTWFGLQQHKQNIKREERSNQEKKQMSADHKEEKKQLIASYKEELKIERDRYEELSRRYFELSKKK